MSSKITSSLCLLAVFLALAPNTRLFAEDAVPPAKTPPAENQPNPPPASEAATTDTSASDPVKPVDAAKEAEHAKVRAQADEKAEVGRKALQTYRKDQAGNPNAVVDSAVAFTEAHKLYGTIGDTDSVSEMQANIFWCKKQMNLDAVKLYLAREGKTEALAQMNEVADKKVEVSEAQNYLDRAKKFAGEHTDDFNGVSIRFYEVAERFVGTPIGLEAQKLSLEAQNKYMKWLQSGGMARDTKFTKATVVKAGTRVAIPDEKLQRDSLVVLKKVYAKDYSRRTDGQKRRFAAKLADEAAKSTGDAVTYFTLQNEICRLAQESEDYERLLDTVDLLAGAFTGYEMAEQKKLWLKKITGKPTAIAIATLLDNPKDLGANTAAGKFFCLQLKRWEVGLPMLAISGDAELKAVAEQELSNPTEDSQRIQVGDAWYQATKKGGPAVEKNAMLGRAQFWYLQAKTLTGVQKERVAQRLAEIDKTLPLDPDNIDYQSLTPTQWSKLKGTESIVPARVDRTGPVATLKPGQRVRVVPHPADSWTCQSWSRTITCTSRGVASVYRKSSSKDDDSESSSYYSYSTPYPNCRFGELVVAVEKGDGQSCGIISGPGNVWLMPNAQDGDRKGQIRVKLVAVDDE